MSRALLLCTVLFAACTGPSGNSGQVGERGESGERGEAGPQGAPGVPCAGCVDAASLATNAVGAIAVVDGSIGSVDVDTAQIQQRVSGTCGTNQGMIGIDVAGGVSCTSALASAWTSVHAADFQSTPGSEWSFTTVAACGAATILGGYNLLGSNDSVQLTLAGLPVHTDLRLVADIYYLDSWDSGATPDLFQIAIDGRVVASELPAAQGRVNLCGDGGYLDWIKRIDLVMLHVETTATIDFSGTLNELRSNESWGLDDVRVFVR